MSATQSGQRVGRRALHRLMAPSARRASNRLMGQPDIFRYFESEGDWTPPAGAFGQVYAEHSGRLAVKWVHYLHIYDELFERFRSGMPGAEPPRPIRMLEIGVLSGGSLELWRSYFGPEATIFGIDINPACALLDTPETPVRIGSQADPEFLARVVAEMGGLDIVLDDGSHIAEHQRASLDALLPLLSEGGIYVIEDTITAYWRSYGGGLRRRGQIIEVAKGMVDGLAKWGYRAPFGRRKRLDSDPRVLMASEEIESVAFYDSVIAIRKARRRPPSVRVVGGTPEERRVWTHPS